MTQEPSREQLEEAERFLTNRGMFPHEIEAIAPPLAAFLAARDAETIRPWREAVWKAYEGCAVMTRLLPPTRSLADLENDFDRLADDHRASSHPAPEQRRKRVTPDRKTIVNGKLVEEFYWAGEYIAYIDGHLFNGGYDAAINSVTAPVPKKPTEAK